MTITNPMPACETFVQKSIEFYERSARKLMSDADQARRDGYYKAGDAIEAQSLYAQSVARVLREEILDKFNTACDAWVESVDFGGGNQPAERPAAPILDDDGELDWQAMTALETYGIGHPVDARYDWPRAGLLDAGYETPEAPYFDGMR